MKRRILIVDDDLHRRELLEHALAQGGYTVGTAGQRREAAKCLKSGEWDLLLVDLELEGNSGFDILDVAVRYPAVSVILLTERLDQCELGALIGADAVVEKPADTELLLGTLEMLLEEPATKRGERRASGSGGIRFVSASRRNGSAKALQGKHPRRGPPQRK